MSLSRVKVWISGEVLTASDLNAEFQNILNNAASLFSPLSGTLDLDGNTLILDTAGGTTITSSTATAFALGAGSKTGTPGTTASIADFGNHTFTDSGTAALGTAALYIGNYFRTPTLAATNATVTTTDAANVYIRNAPATGSNQTITNSWALLVEDGAVRFDATNSKASAASATLRSFYLPAVTATLTGSTNITTATGFNFSEFGQPTYSAASALTVTNAATLYIAAAPTGAGAGPCTITNAYGLWVDAGNVRIDDDILWLSGTTFAATLAHNNSATRTYTFPNFDGTMATLAGTEELTSKTLTSPVINTAVTGTAVASQAQQETGSATDVLVTPGRQHFHPSAPKCWGRMTGTGTPATTESYNVASITDGGTGLLTVVIATDLGAATYACVTGGSVDTTGTGNRNLIINTRDFAAGSVLLNCFDTTNPVDPAIVSWAIFGDLA